MKNLIRQKADNHTCIAPYDLKSGDPFMVGSHFMVASTDALSGTTIIGVKRGEFTLKKATGAAWADGDKLYFDATAKNLTKTAGGNTHVAIATGPALSAATVGPAELRIAA